MYVKMKKKKRRIELGKIRIVSYKNPTAGFLSPMPRLCRPPDGGFVRRKKQMARPKKLPADRLSASGWVRLYPEELAALDQLAEILGESRNTVIRQLLCEALKGGPDYFDDGVLDLRRMSRELNSIGRNLNQLSRAANRGQVVNGDDLRRVINAGIVQMEAVKGLYLRAVRATVKRAVLPLYEAAGWTLTQREAASPTPAAARSGSRPPE